MVCNSDFYMTDNFPENQILHRSKIGKIQTHDNLILGQESPEYKETDAPTNRQSTSQKSWQSPTRISQLLPLCNTQRPTPM